MFYAGRLPEAYPLDNGMQQAYYKAADSLKAA